MARPKKPHLQGENYRQFFYWLWSEKVVYTMYATLNPRILADYHESEDCPEHTSLWLVDLPYAGTKVDRRRWEFFAGVNPVGAEGVWCPTLLLCN